ncbi:cell wall metabolism sensor histidine kinase WalK [Cytobacillus spongiae]|jgi:two-component system phosphate regulon sensor histidine kinase PhoR|uniref:two-component system histidine kinase PnpS n=1 Tax=Cytobacillus spongiae TaxID=2901381 RepID=UPI001F486843|nr:ATP-binding protein [Cytobacillus spongiae]UII55148.1 cell wall metabolism sensor histidine kinase WalK [Cytobacillus spongiae]
MTKFRTRLLFGLITLIFGVLIGLGLLLGQLFKSYYLNAFDERLEKESEIVSFYIEDKGGIKAISEKDTGTISDLLSARVTVVNSEGEIILDSTTEESDITRHHLIIEDIISGKSKGNDRLEVGGGYNLRYYWKPIQYNDREQGYVFISAKMNEINQAYRQIWWLLIVSLGSALIVILLLATRITARYTKPVESATQVAIELAKGNYRARTYEDHIDETGMLSSSINILARNLQELMKSQEIQQDRLRTLIENMGSGLLLIDSRGYINLINRAYKEFFHIDPDAYVNQLYYDVIEHREVTSLVEDIFMTEEKNKKQLRLPIGIERRHFEVYGIPIIGTNDEWKGVLLVFHDITELKKLEQMRKDFVANVSHELKTPVTSIKGFSETLLDGAMNDEKTLVAFLNIILKESDRLQSLIQDLLDLSKIEKQGFALSVQPFNIAESLHEVITIIEGKASEKSIDLEFRSSSEQVVVEADVYRVKQIFINLISNAISYTPNGGKVSILVNEQEDQVTVTVSDTGIGIEKKEIPRIFERFYRIDKARSRNSGGTGLGLAIVKHLVEAHHGNISVESEVGKGTSFSIVLYKKFPQGLFY